MPEKTFSLNCRKDVLVEDRLFSTLETTVGRLAASLESCLRIQLVLLTIFQMQHWMHSERLVKHWNAIC